MKRWFRARYGVRLSRWLWGPSTQPTIEVATAMRPSPMVGELSTSSRKPPPKERESRG